MATDTTPVRELMIPLSGFPTLTEKDTVREAIRQLHSFCPIGGSSPCGFNELMVVDDQGGLVGRITQQNILRVLFSSLLEPVDIKNYSGTIFEYSDLATLLNGVLIRKGVNHLDAGLTSVIERKVRTITPETDLMHAMAVMVLAREQVLPVVEGGKLLGIVHLAEIFAVLGDLLINTP